MSENLPSDLILPTGWDNLPTIRMTRESFAQFLERTSYRGSTHEALVKYVDEQFDVIYTILARAR